jgi:hypothetical protein
MWWVPLNSHRFNNKYNMRLQVMNNNYDYDNTTPAPMISPDQDAKTATVTTTM